MSTRLASVTAPDFRKLLVIGFDDPLRANEFMLAALRLQLQNQAQRFAPEVP